MLEQRIEQHFIDSADLKYQTAQILSKPIAAAVQAMLVCVTSGGKVLVCGNGGCAALWPPAMAAASDQPAGAYTIVMRDDGARQWAYKGKPVYTYQADQKPGDRAGDNFKDVWHIIKE